MSTIHVKLPLLTFEQLLRDFDTPADKRNWSASKYRDEAIKLNKDYQKLLDNKERDRLAKAEQDAGPVREFYNKHDGKIVWYRSRNHRARVRIIGMRGNALICSLVDKTAQEHYSPGAPVEKIYLGWKKAPALTPEWLEPLKDEKN